MYSSRGTTGMGREQAVRTESVRAAGETGARVAVVILTWQSRADIGICLEALERALGADFRRSTLVVDNASTDGTADFVAARFPDVELLRAERNLGFAGGNNLGIRRAIARGAEFVYLLNPDAVVSPGFLEPVLAGLKRAHQEIVAAITSIEALAELLQASIATNVRNTVNLFAQTWLVITSGRAVMVTLLQASE